MVSQWIRLVICAAAGSFLPTKAASAARIVVDPDAFAAGADISTAFPGVTLSAFGSGSVNGPDVSSPQVFSRPSTHATTGQRVFGNATYFDLWFSDSAEFRADFARPTRYVALDLIADDAFDPMVLRAYNTAGALLDEAFVQGQAGTGVGETAVIQRSAAEIAYVVATNPIGAFGQQFLIDRLIYESGPSTITGAWGTVFVWPDTGAHWRDGAAGPHVGDARAPEPGAAALACLSIAAGLALHVGMRRRQCAITETGDE